MLLSPKDAIACVLLARFLGALELLLTIFYARSHGSLQEELIYSIEYGDQVVRLSDEDAVLCLVDRQKLMKKKSRYSAHFSSFRASQAFDWRLAR